MIVFIKDFIHLREMRANESAEVGRGGKGRGAADWDPTAGLDTRTLGS